MNRKRIFLLLAMVLLFLTACEKTPSQTGSGIDLSGEKVNITSGNYVIVRAKEGTELEKDLAVETLQAFLDDYVAAHGGAVDYIHDMAAVEEMSRQTRCIGFLLPEFPRDALFPYVREHGALPRKTFSIGHSRDKRYYLEARALQR